MNSANALRSEIAVLGEAAGAQGTISTGQGTRPRNEVSLVEALKQAMGNRTMTLSEAARRRVKSGLQHDVAILPSDREHHADTQRRVLARGEREIPGQVSDIGAASAPSSTFKREL